MKEVQIGKSSPGRRVNGSEMPSRVLKAQKGMKADVEVELSLLRWAGWLAKDGLTSVLEKF